jgi:hypothetical protein
MTTASDKWLRKKANETTDKDGDFCLDFAKRTPLAFASYYKVNMAIGICCAFLCFVVLPIGFGFFPKFVDQLFEGHILNGTFSIFVIMGIGAYYLHNGFEGKSLYNKIDKYLDSLIMQEIRSIKDLSKVTETSPDEIVNELKVLQEIGLFRQFSIDRKNMTLIENDGWGLSGAKLKQVSLSCPSCGAKISIFIEASSTSGMCEYCGSLLQV